MRADRRRYLKLVKAFRCALAIIRNDAGVDYHRPERSKIRFRWAKELEAEAGITSDKP